MPIDCLNLAQPLDVNCYGAQTPRIRDKKRKQSMFHLSCKLAKRIFIISRHMTCRADSNMISDALAGAACQASRYNLSRIRALDQLATAH